MSERQLISRDVWYATPPQPGQTDNDLDWGYLEYYSNGDIVFNPERPTDAEIKHRKTCLFNPQDIGK